MIQERIDYLSSPEELRFHAESPESDGRNHVLPDVLYACADKIDQLEKEIERLQSLNKRLVEDGERLLKTILLNHIRMIMCVICVITLRGVMKIKSIISQTVL